MSRAEELRQAAGTLRERVAATRPGPWEAYDDGLVWDVQDRPGDPISGSTEPDDAAYIATMDPSVGLLLAEALETEAQLLDMLAPFTELLNATVEAQGGPKGALRLLMDDDGLPKVVSDSTPSWLRIARQINGATA